MGSSPAENTMPMEQWHTNSAEQQSINSIPETEDHMIRVHCSRDTVHGGKQQAKLDAFTIAGML